MKQNVASEQKHAQHKNTSHVNESVAWMSQFKHERYQLVKAFD